ncbi:GroES-like protein [Peniophora sp. CONT]|nr:GroES-like protein [Peniophora sp. CONT]
MASHRVLQIPAKAAPFELSTRPTPTPGPGQVLIKNETIGLNLIDHFMQAYGIYIPDDKYTPGFITGQEAAGTVEAVGEGVTSIKVGDKVCYQGGPEQTMFAFQEKSIADAVRCCKVPNGITVDEAATLPLCVATAAVGLYQTENHRGGPGVGLTPPWAEGGLGKYAGQPILIAGGASAVGQFATQFAKLSGFNPIIVTASASSTELCKSRGATHVIDYRTTPAEELPAVVRDITSAPLPVIFDTISQPPTQEACWKLLAPGGALALTRHAVPSVGASGVRRDDAEGKLAVVVYGMANQGVNLKFGEDMYKALDQYLKDGSIKPTKVEIVDGGLEGVQAGLDRIKAGVNGVKLVIHP